MPTQPRAFGVGGGAVQCMHFERTRPHLYCCSRLWSPGRGTKISKIREKMKKINVAKQILWGVGDGGRRRATCLPAACVLCLLCFSHLARVSRTCQMTVSCLWGSLARLSCHAQQLSCVSHAEDSRLLFEAPSCCSFRVASVLWCNSFFLGANMPSLPACFASMLQLTQAVCDLTDSQRVVGLHFLGPNAGEVGIFFFSSSSK